MRNKLEQKHLTIILSYFTTIESIKTFLSINKKCNEVSLFQNHFSKQIESNEISNEKTNETSNEMKFKIFKEKKENRKKTIPMNLFTFFPNIKSISCDSEDIQNHKTIFQHVETIHLTVNDEITFESIDISIRRKIESIKLKYQMNNNKKRSLIDFLPNCKKIVSFSSNVKNIIGNETKISLNEIIFILKDIKENDITKLNILKECSNIQQKVCYFNETDTKTTQKSKEEIRSKLSPLFNSVYCSTIYRIEPTEYYPLDSTFIDLDDLQTKIVKFNSVGCSVERNVWGNRNKQMTVMRIDLRNYTQLEKIKMMSYEQDEYDEKKRWLITGSPRILFDKWKNIKEIENIHSLDEFPIDVSSMKKIRFDETKFNFEITFEEKKVKINEYIKQIHDIDIKEDATLLMNIWKLINKKFEEIEYTLTLGDYRTVVDLDKPSFTYYNLLMIAEHCPMIPKKHIHIICEKNQPFKHIVDKLRKNNSITFSLDIMTEWGSIENIPNDEKTLKIECKFLYPNYIQNKKVCQQIETIECRNDMRDRENSHIDFSEFVNCKKFIYKGTSFDKFDTHEFVLPPNIEEFELELEHQDESYLRIVNLNKLKKLKRFICLSDMDKFGGIYLPNNHYEFVKVSSDCKIVNKKKLKIDKFIVEESKRDKYSFDDSFNDDDDYNYNFKDEDDNYEDDFNDSFEDEDYSFDDYYDNYFNDSFEDDFNDSFEDEDYSFDEFDDY